MGFNTTFNNISVVSWWSVLLVEETRYPEKTTDMSQVIDKLYPILLYYTFTWMRFDITTLVQYGVGSRPAL